MPPAGQSNFSMATVFQCMRALFKVLTITFANVPLAKASHLTYPIVNMQERDHTQTWFQGQVYDSLRAITIIASFFSICLETSLCFSISSCLNGFFYYSQGEPPKGQGVLCAWRLSQPPPHLGSSSLVQLCPGAIRGSDPD